MTTYTFRIEDNLKNTAFDVIRGYGLNPAQALTMFLNEIAATQRLPLNLDYLPTTKTQRAIAELENGEGEVFEITQANELIVRAREA